VLEKDKKDGHSDNKNKLSLLSEDLWTLIELLGALLSESLSGFYASRHGPPIK